MNKDEYVNLKTLVQKLKNSSNISYNEEQFINNATQLIKNYEEQQRIEVVQASLRVDNIYIEGCWTTHNDLPFFIRKSPSPKIMVANGDTVTATYKIEIRIPEKNIESYIVNGQISLHDRTKILRNMNDVDLQIGDRGDIFC